MPGITWALPAAVDLDHAPAMLHDLAVHLDSAASAEAGGGLTMDVSAVQAFDSSLIALMLEARRRLQTAGGRLTVSGAPPKLVELAKLYGVNELVLGDQPSV